MPNTLLTESLVVIIAAVGAIGLVKGIGFPPILGYLLAGLAIGPHAYEVYRRLLVEEFEAAGTVTLPAFRDRAGVSRRVAQQVLERFDADRLTLRMGDARRLRRGAREP